MTDVRWKLNRARSIDKEIFALQADLEEERDRVTHITQNYTGDTGSGTKDPHKFDRLAELAHKVNEKIDELLQAKAEILDMIYELPEGKQRVVLIDYYVRIMTMEQIAVEQNCTFRNITAIKKRAIQNLEKIF